ncbi:MAG: Fe-S cluster assembly protein SufD [Spirochaetales bacterium]|nr:Fe-S cluster assembly protein SufD [Spirochaetales bacterium]
MNQQNKINQKTNYSSELRKKAENDFKNIDWPKRNEEAWRRLAYEEMDIEAYKNEKNLAPLLYFKPSEKPRDFSGYIEFRGNKCVTRILGDEIIKGNVFVEVFENKQALVSDLAVENQSLLYQRIKNKFQYENIYKWDHGIQIKVPKGKVVTKPLYIVLDEKGIKARRFFHVLVQSETSSQFKITMILKSAENQNLLLNSHFHYVVGDNARLEIVQHQLLNKKSRYFGSTTADVGRDAFLSHFNGVFGATRSKEFIDFNLMAQGAELHSDGLYYVESGQFTDIQSEINHVAANTSSRTFYKGVLENQARSVYQGLIHVGKTAENTDAYLTNKNLLLGHEARADSIPSLDIKNNNVKCSHGSTTGKINQDQLFYLESRGFSESEAQELLVLAYLNEITKKIDDQEAAWILNKIQKRRKVRS